MTKENLVRAPEGRVRRSQINGGQRLKVKGGDPNYVYRIVNDVDDRIHNFLERGWEFDLDERIRVGDSRIDDLGRLGKVKLISVGGGFKAVLMKIKKEWFDEDQAAKMEYVKKTEHAMRPNPNEGTYGPGLTITSRLG